MKLNPAMRVAVTAARSLSRASAMASSTSSTSPSVIRCTCVHSRSENLPRSLRRRHEKSARAVHACVDPLVQRVELRVSVDAGGTRAETDDAELRRRQNLEVRHRAHTIAAAYSARRMPRAIASRISSTPK